MNNILFKMIEIEDMLLKRMENGSYTDQLVCQIQLNTLELFKHYPIRSYEESQDVLRQMDLVFGISYR